MSEIAQTTKMLSRKEGGVGYLIFNNPERHNAMSLEMWDATHRASQRDVARNVGRHASHPR